MKRGEAGPVLENRGHILNMAKLILGKENVLKPKVVQRAVIRLEITSEDKYRTLVVRK